MANVDLEAVKTRIDDLLSPADAEPFHRILDSVGLLRAEVGRLRAIERAANAWADAVEASEEGEEESEEYIDASHGIFVALGRSKPV